MKKQIPIVTKLQAFELRWLRSRGDRDWRDVKWDESGNKYVVMYNGEDHSYYKSYLPITEAEYEKHKVYPQD